MRYSYWRYGVNAVRWIELNRHWNSNAFLSMNAYAYYCLVHSLVLVSIHAIRMRALLFVWLWVYFPHNCRTLSDKHPSRVFWMLRYTQSQYGTVAFVLALNAHMNVCVCECVFWRKEKREHRVVVLPLLLLLYCNKTPLKLDIRLRTSENCTRICATEKERILAELIRLQANQQNEKKCSNESQC